MLTKDQILNISSDELSKLSVEERKYVIKILKEFEQYGDSQTLRDVYEMDYEEIPVSIDEFIENDLYIGKSTRNGTSIYPYWRKKYREIFNESLGYEEIVLTGAIGVGKTRTAVVCLAYILYKIMCLRNPQEYFRFNEGDEITIFFLNITLKLAEGVGFKTLHEFLLNSPWFMARGTVSGRTELRYVPPKHISIDFGSKADHVLGKQVVAGFMDEVDFTRGGIKGGDILDAENGIMQAYTAIKERINSRFIKNGVQYGRLFLVSSKKTEHDFIESYVKKIKNSDQADKLLVVDEPQWVIKPENTFSKERFPIAVGNRSLRSRLLQKDISDEELDALKKQGYSILYVPEDLKQSFIVDINTALMNLAGISVIGTTSFFNFDMFSKCYIKDYKNPFVTDILTIGLKDDLNISDFFEMSRVPSKVRSMPLFIHIDGSLTGDRTGISCVGVSGLKELKQYNGADEIVTYEMLYKHVFSVAIQAPQGTEISFEKTRKFIYFLRANGFNIQGISVDGFQSADMRQMLQEQGYETTLISLDRSPDGYMALRSAMNDGRIGMIQIELLENELIELQRDVRTGKLDHPKDGCFTGDTEVIVINRYTEEQTAMKIVDLISCYKDYLVLTVNEQTGEIEPDEIVNVFKTKDAGIILNATFENEIDDDFVIRTSITSTPDHRYMLESGEFAEIETMPLGTTVKTVDGNTIRLMRKEIVYLEHAGEYEPVYDITVKRNHNFALYNGVVVHNSKDVSDSLAGALFNAMNHKQTLIDTMQVFDTLFDINEEQDDRDQFMSSFQQSLMQSSQRSQNSQLAAKKLEELMNDYDNGYYGNGSGSILLI